MFNERGQIRQCDGLRVLANWVLRENVLAYVHEAICSNMVRDIANFLTNGVSINQTRLHYHNKVVFIIEFGARCLSMIFWNADLRLDCDGILAQKAQVTRLRKCEITGPLIVNHE